MFEKVDRQSAMSQGDPGSKNPGYQIWSNEEPDRWDFLGFVVEEELESTIQYYQSSGNEVYFGKWYDEMGKSVVL
jgi:hypothetical protein